jgi:glycosyltransferase involved in cell wall biosynthesis
VSEAADGRVDADVVIVNWNSGHRLADAVMSLRQQEHVALRVLVIDNASSDDSLARARETDGEFQVLQTHANLGYTGGNNAGIAQCDLDIPVIVANPDVLWDDATAVRKLLDALAADPTVAAVAPLIVDHCTGTIEYLDSVVDLDRALAVHTETYLSELPERTPATLRLPWIDGAALAIQDRPSRTWRIRRSILPPLRGCRVVSSRPKPWLVGRARHERQRPPRTIVIPQPHRRRCVLLLEEPLHAVQRRGSQAFLAVVVLATVVA